MMLADRLNKSVEEIIQLSTLEMDLWLGYMKYENDQEKKQSASHRPPPAPRRRR
jgi:hypothetical protein